jgi:hypothetical protein
VKRPQKITLGQMRVMGIGEVLICCADYKCSHSIEMSADQRPDHLRQSDIEQQFHLHGMRKRGADARGNFPQAKMRRNPEAGVRDDLTLEEDHAQNHEAHDHDQTCACSLCNPKAGVRKS